LVLFLNQFSHYYVFLYHFVRFIFVHAAFVRIKLMMMMINDGQQTASQCGLVPGIVPRYQQLTPESSGQTGHQQ